MLGRHEPKVSITSITNVANGQDRAVRSLYATSEVGLGLGRRVTDLENGGYTKFSLLSLRDLNNDL